MSLTDERMSAPVSADSVTLEMDINVLDQSQYGIQLVFIKV